MNKRQKILKKKKEAVNEFLQILLSNPFNFKKNVFKVILFGSLAYGDWDKDSDIDLLVFSKKKDKKMEDFLSNAAYDILLKRRELIEPLVYKTKDYKSPSSSFLIEAIKDGKELYSV